MSRTGTFNEFSTMSLFKALMYVMQFKHAVAGCECLDAMREYI